MNRRFFLSMTWKTAASLAVAGIPAVSAIEAPVALLSTYRFPATLLVTYHVDGETYVDETPLHMSVMDGGMKGPEEMKFESTAETGTYIEKLSLRLDLDDLTRGFFSGEKEVSFGIDPFVLGAGDVATFRFSQPFLVI